MTARGEWICPTCRMIFPDYMPSHDKRCKPSPKALVQLRLDEMDIE